MKFNGSIDSGAESGGVDSAAGNQSSAQRVIDVALRHFAEEGFDNVRLDNIAKEAGMSKRMIHYHFGDKKGLYQHSLIEAVNRLHPPKEALVIESAVPVDGVRKMVEALFTQFLRNPGALTMLMKENLSPVLPLEDMPPISDESDMKLHLDKLLLIGQDAGAFRPGISADDFFMLVSAIGFYRVANRRMTQNLFSIDVDAPENVAGTHRLMVDTVLAFLTANIPDSGQSSYLISSDEAPEDDSGVYEVNASADIFDN